MIELLTISHLTRSMTLAMLREFGGTEFIEMEPNAKVGSEPNAKQHHVDFWLTYDELRAPIDDMIINVIEPAAALLSSKMKEARATATYHLALPKAEGISSARYLYDGMSVRGIMEGPLYFPAVPLANNGQCRARFDVLFRETAKAEAA